MVGGRAVTPMKRVPILANFEEWMKMATDNKINAANSWNFALIDYFHDMSLLKEGDSVNFQKASCTLDGCVKIYTSRVDSVATETGKLLSGLADSRDSKKKDREDGGEDDDEEEEEVDEDGTVRKKPKKKTQRSSEATLAPSFASLQLKKLELEFAVDPLFKKASADFDEGGAKGLLLNHLMIDSQGRIVFDSSDDAEDVAEASAKPSREADDERPDSEDADADGDISMTDRDASAPGQVETQPEEEDEDVEIEIAALGAKYFPDLSILDSLDVCPSLKTFDLGDPSGSLDIPFLKVPDDWRHDQEKEKTPGLGSLGNKSAMFIDDENPDGFDDDDGLGTFDMGADVGFGEGGEAWAKEAALEPHAMRVYDAGLGDGTEGDGEGDGADLMDAGTGEYVVAMSQPRSAEKIHEDILSYFDRALQKNWTSAEHWRIRKIKDVNKPNEPTRQRKEKQPFEIDFVSPLDKALAEIIYTKASSNATISMPKKDWKSKTKNLLPDDKHFSSKQLLSLFLKPKARMGRRRVLKTSRIGNIDSERHDDLPEGEVDEAFWATQKAPLANGNDRPGRHPDDDDEPLPQGDYDANFFADDGLPFAGGMDDDDDMDRFSDAREHFSPEPGAGGPGMNSTAGLQDLATGIMGQNPGDGAFGTNLVTQGRRVRPEYVQYARVAKKVDVRRLKEEIWKGMGFDELTVRYYSLYTRLPPCCR